MHSKDLIFIPQVQDGSLQSKNKTLEKIERPGFLQFILLHIFMAIAWIKNFDKFRRPQTPSVKQLWGPQCTKNRRKVPRLWGKRPPISFKLHKVIYHNRQYFFFIHNTTGIIVVRNHCFEGGKNCLILSPKFFHIFNYCVACPTTTNLNLIEIHGIYRQILVIAAAGSEMIKQMQFPIVWTPQCKRNLIFRKICIPPAKTFQSFCCLLLLKAV